jgi:hypothetical protein
MGLESHNAATTVVASATTVGGVELLARNTRRKGAMIFNDSSAILYIGFGSGAVSATAHAKEMAAGEVYQLPLMQDGVYNGLVKGIWASVNGEAKVTEFT